MKVNFEFKPNTIITIEDYLYQCGIVDVKEYLSGGKNHIENPTKYPNMEKGYKIFKKNVVK